MVRHTRSIVLAALAAVSGSTAALAQDAPAAPASAAPAPADTAAPAAPAASSAASGGNNVMGYGYGPRASSHAAGPSTPVRRARLPHHANEAMATLAGFEMLADGGSRLFVQLSRQVDVEQTKGTTQAAPAARKGKRARAAADKVAIPAATTTLTFVLKGTEVVRRNDENALVTVHFNTPVVRARLAPSGHDLRFIVDLRADVTPQMKVVAAKDNGAMLQIDFPQGSYLPAGAAQPPPPEPNAPQEAGDSVQLQPQ